jgi:hypothetical protein
LQCFCSPLSLVQRSIRGRFLHYCHDKKPFPRRSTRGFCMTAMLRSHCQKRSSLLGQDFNQKLWHIVVVKHLWTLEGSVISGLGIVDLILVVVILLGINVLQDVVEGTVLIITPTSITHQGVRLIATGTIMLQVGYSLCTCVFCLRCFPLSFQFTLLLCNFFCVTIVFVKIMTNHCVLQMRACNSKSLCWQFMKDFFESNAGVLQMLAVKVVVSAI